MRLLYDKWRIPIDDSFQESEERGARVFRHEDKAVYVWRRSDGLSKTEGIQRVKAGANPRHVAVFEEERGHVYRWAFKHAEEKETASPTRYVIEAHYVIDGEDLTVCTEHKQLEDQRWAAVLVSAVEFDRDWDVTGNGYIYVAGKYVFGSFSRTDDGQWFGNRFVGSVPAGTDAAQLG
jgi:hypothetical protein